MLIHNGTVNRTGRKPDGSGFDTPVSVADLTLAELKELDFGAWFSENFKGTKILELSELLDFVRENKIPIKFDNVIETATASQLDYFLSQIENSGVEEYIGITAKDIKFVAKVIGRLKKRTIHYDGPTGKEIYWKLISAADGHELFIRLPSEKKMWLPYPPTTSADVELAKQYAKVGLWTARDRNSLEYILSLNPDAMEIDGCITPEDIK